MKGAKRGESHENVSHSGDRRFCSQLIRVIILKEMAAMKAPVSGIIRRNLSVTLGRSTLSA